MKAFLAKWRFLRAYDAELRRPGTHESAVRAGLARLALRPPFDILSPSDIEKAAEVFSLIPEAAQMAAVVANIVKKDNAHALKDKWFREKLAEEYRGIRRKTGLPAR